MSIQDLGAANETARVHYGCRRCCTHLAACSSSATNAACTPGWYIDSLSRRPRPRVKDNLSAFKQRLHELGWDEGRNIRFDYRFTGQVPDRIRAGSQELIALAPDIIVVWANPAAAIVRKATQTIPIVFVSVSDPIGGGFVTNLARPGGNITGFQNFETAIGGKWLQVLKEIAPERAPRSFRPQSGHLRACRVHASGGSGFQLSWGDRDIGRRAHCGRDRTCVACIREGTGWRPHRGAKPLQHNQPGANTCFGF